MRRGGLRVATLEECAEYGQVGLRRRGLLPPIAGSAGLVLDGSTPAPTTVAVNANSVTTGTFSPVANSLIVVLMAIGVAAGNVQSTTSVTDNQTTHLNWTQKATVHSTGGNNIGLAEIWIADCPSAITGLTFTANFANGVGGGVAPVGTAEPVVFTGARPVASQTGATGTQQAQGGGVAPSVALTGVTSGSQVVAVFNDWSSNDNPTTVSGQTTTINGTSTVNANATDTVSYWDQILTSLSGGGSVTMGDNPPATYTGVGAAMEIAAAVVASASSFTPHRMPLGV